MRACAKSERTNVMCSAPSTSRFSTYCALAAQEPRIFTPHDAIAEDAHTPTLSFCMQRDNQTGATRRAPSAAASPPAPNRAIKRDIGTAVSRPATPTSGAASPPSRN